MDIAAQVRQFLAERLVLGDRLDKLKGDESFLENGVVDSTGILELILFAEERFGVQVRDDEVVPENFDSINRLAGYISRKLAA